MLTNKENAQTVEQLLAEYFTEVEFDDLEDSFLHTVTEAIHSSGNVLGESQFYCLFRTMMLIRRLDAIKYKFIPQKLSA